MCAASLPTTMGIIAGFLSQTVLKYLLDFGEVSQFLGYNAFTDFFPKYPLGPNPECCDSKCQERQKQYGGVPPEDSRLHGRAIKLKKEQEIAKVVTHSENEWGISMDGGEDSSEAEVKKETFIEVKKEQSLAELMASMKKLQSK